MTKTNPEPSSGERMMDTIGALCGIPDRTPATYGEHQASQYLANALEELGAEVRVQSFETFPDLPGLLALHSAIAAVGGAVGLKAPAIGAAITGAASLSLHQELSRGDWDWLRKVLPKKPSQNVLGILRSGSKKECPKHRIVLSAHLDSALTGPLFHPTLARTLSSMSHRLTGKVAAVGDAAFHITWPLAAVSALRAIPSLSKSLRPLQLGLLALQASSILVNGLSSLRHKPSPGANDNASGVAVILEAARYFSKNPVDDAEIWILGTGSEEAHLQGMCSFFAQGGEGKALNPQRDWVINLDTVGKGTLRYLTKDGMVRTTEYSDKSIELARSLCDKKPFECVADATMSLATDGLVAARKGLPTISLVALDQMSYVDGYHWHTDCPETIESEAMMRALHYTMELAASIPEFEAKKTV